MLGFVSLFLKTLKKCASNMEEIIHSSQCGDGKSKVLEERLSSNSIFKGSADKVLEMVMNASMIMACNLQLARRDTTLKQCAPKCEHDRNRLGRSGFISGDLFSPAIQNAIEKNLEKERSPKRQKLDMKSIFQSKKPQYSSNSHSYRSSYSQYSVKSWFRDYKGQQQQKSAQSSRVGHGGRRK